MDSIASDFIPIFNVYVGKPTSKNVDFQERRYIISRLSFY